jgi:hypothetical protein
MTELEVKLEQEIMQLKDLIAEQLKEIERLKQVRNFEIAMHESQVNSLVKQLEEKVVK